MRSVRPTISAWVRTQMGEAAVAGQYVSGSEDPEAARDPRAAQHSHTAWQHEYFVLTGNRNYPDVRMSVKQRWKGDAHLGRACGSKTLVPRHFGGDWHAPDQVFLAFRAWMLYRWQGKLLPFHGAPGPPARVAAGAC